MCGRERASGTGGREREGGVEDMVERRREGERVRKTATAAASCRNLTLHTTGILAVAGAYW
jgi:hypothetical protein